MLEAIVDAVPREQQDEADAVRVSGTYFANSHLKRIITDLPPLRTVVVSEVIPFELWLAHKTSEWRARYVGD